MPTQEYAVRVRPVYRLAELAEDFGCSKKAIYEAIKAGQLKSFRLGQQLRVCGEDALAWRDGMRRRGGEAA